MNLITNCSFAGVGDPAHEHSGNALRLRGFSHGVRRSTDAWSSEGQRDAVGAHGEGGGGNCRSTLRKLLQQRVFKRRRKLYAELRYCRRKGIACRAKRENLYEFVVTTA